MTTTNLSNAAFKSGDDYAFPHSKVDGQLQPIEFVNLDNAAPAGSINSSAAEMAKWISLQLNRGNFPPATSACLLRPSRVKCGRRKPFCPLAKPGSACATQHQIRCLWFRLGLRDYHGRKLVGHTGGVAVSFLAYARSRRKSRRSHSHHAEQEGAFDSILYHILDHYFAVRRRIGSPPLKLQRRKSRKRPCRP